MRFARALYRRFAQLIYEFAKFGVVGIAGLLITNAVYGLLFLHLGVGPVTSTTIATIVAAIATYVGNRYWSFSTRQRTGVVHELIVFAVLNGIGLLIQDTTVAVNAYLLHLGHNKLASFTALNVGIALATLFRFWSYRRFVWVEPRATAAGPAQVPRDADTVVDPPQSPGPPAQISTRQGRPVSLPPLLLRKQASRTAPRGSPGPGADHIGESGSAPGHPPYDGDQRPVLLGVAVVHQHQAGDRGPVTRGRETAMAPRSTPPSGWPTGPAASMRWSITSERSACTP